MKTKLEKYRYNGLDHIIDEDEYIFTETEILALIQAEKEAWETELLEILFFKPRYPTKDTLELVSISKEHLKEILSDLGEKK